MVGSGLTTRLDIGRPAKLHSDVHVQNWTICAAYVVGGEQHGAILEKRHALCLPVLLTSVRDQVRQGEFAAQDGSMSWL